MNAFLSALEKHDIKEHSLKKGALTTLQVNMGNLCNQSCLHCHIGGSPEGGDIMPRKVVDDIIKFISKNKINTLDITGGAPELNPDFDYLVLSARPLINEIIVRSNLTVIFEPGKEYLPEFFKANRVHLACSLPCYTKENVDYQRGRGVFEKSMKALRIMNGLGFSKEEGLILDLVYNPAGAYLPKDQLKLEEEYKHTLRDNYGINFNRLITITNVAINKFKHYLDSNGEYERYYGLLEDNFNPLILDKLMCRSFLSVGFNGRLYDCDFNLSLGLALRKKNGDFLSIAGLKPADLENSEIIIGEHCLSCTAGSGSSCRGALIQEMPLKESRKAAVRQYYGRVLKDRSDLKTGACCLADSMPPHYKDIISKIEPEILNRFYGCGSPIPDSLSGCRVLDLGSGTGRDVYLASYLAGEEGFVVGVDMTDEQLEVSRKYKDSQMHKFGFKKCNVEFKKGYIEDLKEIGIEDNSFDIVISNCVINLSTDKRAVFSEIFRVLRPGGELYFSDIFSDRRVPEHIANDPLLYGECLGGALYIEDFRRILRRLGCPDYRVVSAKKITPNESEIAGKIGMVNFYSVTIRAFKLDDLEDICEDYGQVATYSGTILHNPHQFHFDKHHLFITNKPMLVCGNTASMLGQTRYAGHFKIEGDRSVHYGPFPCGPDSGQKESHDTYGSGNCC